MLYAAKCYWPGVDDRELQDVAQRAVRVPPRNADDGIAFHGSLLFSDDGLVSRSVQRPVASGRQTRKRPHRHPMRALDARGLARGRRPYP